MTSGALNSASRLATVGKLYPSITQFADVWTDRGSRQIQRFSNLTFPAPFPPEQDQQLVALGFGRGSPRQEFGRSEWPNMTIHHPHKQIGEADLQCAREPDQREDPEISGAALEINKIAPTHRRSVAESLLRKIGLAPSELDVLPQAAER